MHYHCMNYCAHEIDVNLCKKSCQALYCMFDPRDSCQLKWGSKSISGEIFDEYDVIGIYEFQIINTLCCELNLALETIQHANDIYRYLKTPKYYVSHS